MIWQYGAQRARRRANPLQIGTMPIGAIFYIQNEEWWRDRHTPACGTAALLPCATDGAGKSHSHVQIRCRSVRQPQETSLSPPNHRPPASIGLSEPH